MIVQIGIAAFGLLLGLLPFLQTFPLSPARLIDRHISFLYKPLKDNPKGTVYKSLLRCIGAAILWGGIGVAILFLPKDISFVVQSIILGSICNLTATPIRILKASKLMHKKQPALAYETLAPISPDVFWCTPPISPHKLYRRATETLIAWFSKRIVGGIMFYLLMGMPGMLVYATILAVSDNIDRNRYALKTVIGPIILTTLTSYAASYLSMYILWLGSAVTPGARFKKSSRGLAMGMGVARPQKRYHLRHLELEPPLHVVCHAFNIQLMGPSDTLPYNGIIDTWLGPDDGRIDATHGNLLRISWLVFCCILLILSGLIVSYLPQHVTL